MKFIYKVVKRLAFSFGIIYAYNMIMQQFNIPIPFNITTLSITTILGIPGFIGLIVFYFINFR